jgi:hypothetical protein
MDDLKKDILAEYEKGNIVVASMEGLQVCKLEDFIKQPVDGMLYDLNRLETVVLTFLPDPKWVNDYAVSKVLRAMQAKIEELQHLLATKDDRRID